VELGVKDLRAMKSLYDSAYLAGDSSAMDRTVIWFEGPLSIATAGMCHTEYALGGPRLQNLSDPNVIGEGLTLGFASADHGGAIVFSWPVAYHTCYEFIASLLARKPNDLPNVIVTLIFASIENVYSLKSGGRACDLFRRRRSRYLQETYGRTASRWDILRTHTRTGKSPMFWGQRISTSVGGGPAKSGKRRCRGRRCSYRHDTLSWQMSFSFGTCQSILAQSNSGACSSVSLPRFIEEPDGQACQKHQGHTLLIWERERVFRPPGLRS
jgi:hypothetical protein